MQIIITKGESRNTLLCERADGSSAYADLGPSMPHHDLAHYVVELNFELREGFFGQIMSGRTIDELSDKEVIKSLGPQAWLAEVMARNLQSISSGAAMVVQYAKLVKWEAETLDGVISPEISREQVDETKARFDQLCADWEQVPVNGELTLEFN